jgi:hypothetical protein
MAARGFDVLQADTSFTQNCPRNSFDRLVICSTCAPTRAVSVADPEHNPELQVVPAKRHRLVEF